MKIPFFNNQVHPYEFRQPGNMSDNNNSCCDLKEMPDQFEAKLKIVGQTYARQAFRVVLEVLSYVKDIPYGTKLIMNIDQFYNMTLKGQVDKGVIDGTWAWSKHGAYCTLKFIS